MFQMWVPKHCFLNQGFPTIELHSLIPKTLRFQPQRLSSIVRSRNGRTSIPKRVDFNELPPEQFNKDGYCWFKPICDQEHVFYVADLFCSVSLLFAWCSAIPPGWIIRDHASTSQGLTYKHVWTNSGRLCYRSY